MSELIKTARRLANATGHRPSQADLRRAVSTAYYAMFTALATLCANQVVGSSPQKRALPEWARTYRALDHGRSETVMNELDPERRSKAKQGIASSVDNSVEIFAETLDRLKLERHAADYDPGPLKLKRKSVLNLIGEAEAAILLLDGAPDDAKRQLAFACVVNRRKGG